MVNCLRNADCWKVSPLSGTWCDLCFVTNTGASHMEPRKLGKQIDYSSGMCMGNLNTQNALHVESAKQLFITIFIPVVEHTPTLRHVFVFIFLVCLPFFSYMAKLIFYSLHTPVCSKWSGFNGGNFSNFCYSDIFLSKKKIPGYKESLFVLNHLIHIFSIYMYYMDPIIYIHDNLILVRSVGTSYSAWEKVTVGGKKFWAG